MNDVSYHLLLVISNQSWKDIQLCWQSLGGPGGRLEWKGKIREVSSSHAFPVLPLFNPVTHRFSSVLIALVFVLLCMEMSMSIGKAGINNNLIKRKWSYNICHRLKYLVQVQLNTVQLGSSSAVQATAARPFWCPCTLTNLQLAQLPIQCRNREQSTQIECLWCFVGLFWEGLWLLDHWSFLMVLSWYRGGGWSIIVQLSHRTTHSLPMWDFRIW